jgi:hypothetical protein
VLAVAVVVVAVAIAVVLPGGDGDRARPQAADAPPAPPAPPPPSLEGVEPLPGSSSDPLHFTVAGTRYTAVGFQSSQSTVCMTLTKVDSGLRPSVGCLGMRLLPDALAKHPARLFAGGGGGPDGIVRKGFARADAVEVAPVDRASGLTVVLSEPWRPEPWEGEPIRFFFVFDPEEEAPSVPSPALPLEVRLSDGRTVQVP